MATETSSAAPPGPGSRQQTAQVGDLVVSQPGLSQHHSSSLASRLASSPGNGRCAPFQGSFIPLQTPSDLGLLQSLVWAPWQKLETLKPCRQLGPFSPLRCPPSMC